MVSTVSNHIRYKQNQLHPHAPILNSSLTPGESSATRLHHLHNTRGSGWESPLKRKAGLCHCHPEAGSIHSSQVHSNKAAGKNGPRSVSFLPLYDAHAYVAGLQIKQLAPREAGNFTRLLANSLIKQNMIRFFFLSYRIININIKACFLTAKNV